MKRYLAKSWCSPIIETIEIERETKKSYWVKEKNRWNSKTSLEIYRKKSVNENMFDTFQEAKDCLVEMWNNKTFEARKEASDLHYVLGEILKMAEE